MDSHGFRDILQNTQELLSVPLEIYRRVFQTAICVTKIYDQGNIKRKLQKRQINILTDSEIPLMALKAEKQIIVENDKADQVIKNVASDQFKEPSALLRRASKEHVERWRVILDHGR
ncbi:hypothetical protein HHI36_002138 [Cryptolaemus montrouzieri]|uniref:Uncharacterized protein n=1 Tax=Cryptolaemus montrouzieri TaxID=559131 RepID=A0ABD2P9N4_9CUCU